uniref:Ubiquitin-like protein 3 n=1 Tax=Phallusia mammillata TaxID=59560 RepID=A0A6F9DX71_9ASCI|nr:ubiquitin-like protein 3 [Phallusia mammillata]
MTDNTSSESVPPGNNTPVIKKDKIALKLLRVSGQYQTFYFNPSDSASDIARHVFENWPAEWTEDTATSHDVLRLIYQGRFLHGNATLGALKIPVGKMTVMHLVCRETLPEPHSQEQRSREKSREGRCQLCCCIL